MRFPARLPDAQLTPSPSVRRVRPLPIVAVLVVAVMPRSAPVLLAAIGVGWVTGRVRSARRVRAQQLSRSGELPVALTLLQIAAAAGHGPRRAIALVGQLGWGGVSSQLASVAERLAHGVALSDAVEGLDPPRLTELLVRADEDGGRWAAALDVYADDVHRDRAAALEERTGRLTVALLVPLVSCILPAFVLISLAPVLGDAVVNLFT